MYFTMKRKLSGLADIPIVTRRLDFLFYKKFQFVTSKMQLKKGIIQMLCGKKTKNKKKSNRLYLILYLVQTQLCLLNKRLVEELVTTTWSSRGVKLHFDMFIFYCIIMST